MTAGEYVRNKRTVSLRQLAKEIGISASYLSDVERDNRKINIKMAARIAKALQTTPGGVWNVYDELLELSGLMTPERKVLIMLYAECFGDTSETPVNTYLSHIAVALYNDIEALISGKDMRAKSAQQKGTK